MMERKFLIKASFKNYQIKKFYTLNIQVSNPKFSTRKTKISVVILFYRLIGYAKYID